MHVTPNRKSRSNRLHKPNLRLVFLSSGWLNKLAHAYTCFLSCVDFCFSDNIVFQVRTSRIGYYTLNEDLTIASNTERHAMIQQDMVISPRLSLRGSDDMYRIVLTWGKTPKDLDSYLITPWPREPKCQSGMVS